MTVRENPLFFYGNPESINGREKLGRRLTFRETKPSSKKTVGLLLSGMMEKEGWFLRTERLLCFGKKTKKDISIRQENRSKNKKG